MNITRYFLCVLLSLAGSIASPGQNIGITNTDGKTIEVTPLALSGEIFEFRMPSSGKPFKVPLEKLDAASQERVKAWADSPAAMSTRFKLDVEMRNSNTKAGKYDYDDRRQVLRPSVEVRNRERRASAPAKVMMIVLGSPVTISNRLRCVMTETKELKSLPGLAETIVDFSDVSFIFDNKKYVKHGTRYYGYVCYVIVDDEVVSSVSHPGGLRERPFEVMSQLRPGGLYKSNFSDVLR